VGTQTEKLKNAIKRFLIQRGIRDVEIAYVVLEGQVSKSLDYLKPPAENVLSDDLTLKRVESTAL
jgi:hypothetical protein